MTARRPATRATAPISEVVAMYGRDPCSNWTKDGTTADAEAATPVPSTTRATTLTEDKPGTAWPAAHRAYTSTPAATHPVAIRSLRPRRMTVFPFRPSQPVAALPAVIPVAGTWAGAAGGPAAGLPLSTGATCWMEAYASLE